MNAADLHSPQQSAVPLDPTPGQLLAAARNEHHMSVGDVANRLKLSVAQVQALEADAYDRLPGPVFVRGFMRNYARLVGLDGEHLLRAVKLPADADEARERPEKSVELPLQRERRWPRYVAVATAIFAIAAAIDFLWPETRTQVASSGAPLSSSEVAQVPAQPPAPTAVQAAPDGGAGGASPGAAAEGASAVSTKQDRATVAATQGPGAAPAIPSPDSGSAAGSAEPAAAARAEASSASRAQLRLAFTAPSWVEVRDRDGHVILSQLNSPGTTRELNGSAPLSLIIGNARGVRLMYNDQPVDLARYTRVDVARLTLK